jgi:hypothetical protein
MAIKPSRAALQKEFFAGNLTYTDFKAQIETRIKFRGFYIQPGKKPQWSSKYWRDTIEEAIEDNMPWRDKGYLVDVYTRQY